MADSRARPAGAFFYQGGIGALEIGAGSFGDDVDGLLEVRGVGCEGFDPAFAVRALHRHGGTGTLESLHHDSSISGTHLDPRKILGSTNFR